MFDELFTYFSRDPKRLYIAIAFVVISIAWFALRGRISSLLHRFAVGQKLSAESQNIMTIALIMFAFLIFAFVCFAIFRG